MTDLRHCPFGAAGQRKRERYPLGEKREAPAGPSSVVTRACVHGATRRNQGTRMANIRSPAMADRADAGMRGITICGSDGKCELNTFSICIRGAR